MKTIIKLLTLSLLIILLSGCGGEGGSDTPTDTSTDTSTNTPIDTSTDTPTKTGYFIDSEVQGIDYICDEVNGTTLADGSFKYIEDRNITFSIGNVTLGTFDTKNINKDKVLLPTDLSNTTRDDTENEKVVKIITLLQSLDDDQYPYNGITITDTTKQLLNSVSKQDLQNSTSDLDVIFNTIGKTKLSTLQTKAHFKNTLISRNLTTQTCQTEYCMYGKWIYVNSGTNFNIYSNTDINYTKVDNNLIQVVQDDNSTLYAMRAGTSGAKVIGKVQSYNNSNERALRSSGGYSGIANMDVILENITDSSIKTTVKTDSNGQFETESVPAGDYTFTIDNIEQNITVEDNIENLGAYTIVSTDTNNFKVSLVLDDEFIYADNKQYSGKIIVENISNV